ncbi:Jouberin [Schistosoma japonicum]|nr:Jouberin [Schistosoma japonicum]
MENESFEMEEVTSDHQDSSSTRYASKSIGKILDKKISSRSKKISVGKSIVTDENVTRNDGILEIIVHRTDRLKVIPSICNLFVRIHIMDTETEDYIKCKEKISDIPEERLVAVAPINTKVVSTKYQDLLMPVWDDILIINENFCTFASNKNTILFFEILDSAETKFGKSNHGDVKTLSGQNIGYFMIAWAFLLLTNSSGQLNSGSKKQRLQLYEPITKVSVNPAEKSGNLPIGKVSTLSVLQRNQLMKSNAISFSEYNTVESGYHLLSCWKSGSRYRVPYPSSLYVTVKETLKRKSSESYPHDNMSTFVMQSNVNTNESNECDSSPKCEGNTLNVVNENELNELQKSWTRKLNQPCRIPNMLVGYGITTCTKSNDNFNLSITMKTNQNDSILTKSSGAQCITFSPDGKWLAVGVIQNLLLNMTTYKTNKMNCSVLIYKFPFDSKRNQPHLELAGHSDIIYSLDWAKTPVMQTYNRISNQESSSKGSFNSKLFWILASGSADGTVRVWRLHLDQVYEKSVNDGDNSHLYMDVNMSISPDASTSQVQVGQIINRLSHNKGVLCNVLGHPNFVYSVAFKPVPKEFDLNESQAIQSLTNRGHLLATACYDRTIRLWNIKPNEAQLLQELNGVHQSHINTLTFDTNGSRIYSGDALGMIVVWQEATNQQQKKVKFQSKWIFEKKIEVRELEMCIINHLEFHPTLNLLLVHTRDNCIKMLDLRSDFITTRYHGVLNNNELLRSCISPCGTFLFSGSEDNNVYVWNVNTGDQVASYQNLMLPGSVTSISYHPTNNVIAFAAVGPDSPIAVYTYSIKASQLTTLHRTSKEENLYLQEEKSKFIEQPPDILSSHIKFKQYNAERVLLAMSKLESVLSISKPLTRPIQNDLHELEWRPTFTVIDEISDFQSTVNKLDSIKITEPQTKSSEGSTTVFTALYDYQAQRSDELNFRRGDTLKLLYKDTPKWWMARLISTGHQGFVPANYLSGNVDCIDSDQLTTTNKYKSSNLFEENMIKQSSKPLDSTKNDNLQLWDSSCLVDNANIPRDSQSNQYKYTDLSNIDMKFNKRNSMLMKKRKSSARPLPILN